MTASIQYSTFANEVLKRGICFLLENISLSCSLGFPLRGQHPELPVRVPHDCSGSLPSWGNSHTDTGRYPFKRHPGRDYAQATAPEPTASRGKQGKVVGAVRAERLKAAFNSKNLPCTTDQILSSATKSLFYSVCSNIIKDSTMHCFINSPILYEHKEKQV